MAEGGEPDMREGAGGARITTRLVNALYTEAMLLADDARSYFEEQGRAEREALPPMLRVGFSCESLKVTTRLMHVIAWLLTRRALDAGELSPEQLADPERRLGEAAPSDSIMVDGLPEHARQLIVATSDLHARVRRLDEEIDRVGDPAPSPARELIRRLECAF
jgi:regulator of CtrA degradation